MDESVIRGRVVGGALGALGLAATLVWKLMASSSEGARRLKLVLKISGAFAVAVFVYASAGNPAEGIGLLAILGVIIWVARGFRK